MTRPDVIETPADTVLAAPRRSWLPHLGRVLPPLAILAALAGLWEAATHWFGVPDYLLPSLESIFSTMSNEWPVNIPC